MNTLVTRSEFIVFVCGRYSMLSMYVEKSAQIMQRYQVSRILKEKKSWDKERGIKHKLHLGKESKSSKRDVLKQQSQHFYSIKIKSMETTSSWVFLLWFLHL